VVQGNRIGTVDGKTALPNLIGVFISFGATNNLIGGTTAAARNIISGNPGVGVRIEDNGLPVTGNVIEGNYIGVGADGLTPLPNQTGVVISTQAANNTVGGTAPGAGNVIAFNGDDGVLIGQTLGIGTEAGAGNAVLGNRIFGNGKVGIDLGPTD